MKTLDEQISALEMRLELMKYKKREDMARTYAPLIGSCLKLNHCTYHMITAIREVKELCFNDPDIKDDKEINYECIQVLWNPREKAEYRTAEICNNKTGRIDASAMPKFIIPYSKFSKALNDCSTFINEYVKTTSQKTNDHAKNY